MKAKFTCLKININISCINSALNWLEWRYIDFQTWLTTRTIDSCATFAGKLCYSLSPLLPWAPRLISCHHKQKKTQTIKSVDFCRLHCVLTPSRMFPGEFWSLSDGALIHLHLASSINFFPKVSRYVTTLAYFIQCFYFIFIFLVNGEIT